jgi:dienelactone hydrolase
MFRAATYYRAADFFIHTNQSDPRIYSLWDSQLAAFDQAISLLDVPGERVNISTPYGFYVQGIFYKAAADDEKRPTIVVGEGYDGAQEDSYHALCTRILERGWNCLTFEGPGQPTVRRQQNKGFISDWWQVVTPVVDYLEGRCDVDKDNLSLIGISYSGLLVPIAATREHRFKSVVTVDGMYNFTESVLAQFPPALIDLFNSGNRTGFDDIMNHIRLDPSQPSQSRWLIDQGLFSFDTESPFEWMTRFTNTSLVGLADQISTPVFIGAGQDDTLTGNQPELLKAALGDLGYFYQFTTASGSGEHCQIGAEAHMAQAVLDWTAQYFE